MKIAYVYDSIYPYTFGGLEKRVWDLSTRLVDLGHEVHIFGPKYWSGEDIFKKEGVYLHGVCKPFKARYVKGRRSIWWPIYFGLKLLPILLKEKFEIIDCQNFPYFPCFSAKIVSITRRTPLVITWIEIWGDYWYQYLGKKGALGKFIEKMTVLLSWDMIAISETTKHQLIDIGIGNRNVTVVPIGVELESIKWVKPAQQISDVIFVGRMIKEKNIDLLIKVISLLKNKFPHIKAVIIGDGPENLALRKLTADMGVADNIRFLGFLEDHNDVIAHLKSSRCFVFPSTREGFGIVVIEANACGLPVIVINHPQNAACDLVVEGQNGFICQFNEAYIANKISDILIKQNSDFRTKCIEHAQKYNWSIIVEKIEGVYTGLIMERDNSVVFGNKEGRREQGK